MLKIKTIDMCITVILPRRVTTTKITSLGQQTVRVERNADDVTAAVASTTGSEKWWL